MNEVYETEEFSKIYDASEKIEQEWIEKVKNQLRVELRVGKPLRYDWFREKRFGNKRLFFLINETSRKAILIAFGTKKEQQKIITYIILNKDRFLRFIS